MLLSTLFLAWFGCGGPDTFRRPNFVAIDDHDQIVISDFHNHRLVVLDEEGKRVDTIGGLGLGHGDLWNVRSLDIDRDGSLLVGNQRVMSTEDGRWIWEVKRIREGAVTDVYPIDWKPNTGWIESIAPTAQGYLVTDTDTFRIYTADHDFRLGAEFATREDPDAAPNIVVASGGDWFVIESYAHVLRRLGPQGQDLWTLPLEGTEPGRLLYPTGLDVCPGQFIVVADQGNRRINRYSVDGQLQGSFSPAPASDALPLQLTDVAIIDSCQKLVIVDSKGNRVLITDLEGQVIRDIREF